MSCHGQTPDGREGGRRGAGSQSLTDGKYAMDDNWERKKTSLSLHKKQFSVSLPVPLSAKAKAWASMCVWCDDSVRKPGVALPLARWVPVVQKRQDRKTKAQSHW